MTPADIDRELDATADFISTGSLTKARRRVELLEMKLGRAIEEWQHGGERQRFNVTVIERQLARVIAWVKANDPQRASVADTYGSLEKFRAF
jgi:hypothetical protein